MSALGHSRTIQIETNSEAGFFAKDDQGETHFDVREFGRAVYVDRSKLTDEDVKYIRACCVPVSYETAVYHLLRLLSHLPLGKADAPRYQVWVEDVAGDMSAAGLSEIALALVAGDLRRDRSRRFMPPTGELFSLVKDKSDEFKAILAAATSPPALARPRELWKERALRQFGKDAYEHWIKDLRYVPEKRLLLAPSAFVRDRVIRDYLLPIQKDILKNDQIQVVYWSPLRVSDKANPTAAAQH